MTTDKELGPAKAKFGDEVRVHFTCKLEDGSIYDSSEGKEPLQLTIGENKFLEGFENAIVGMYPGESRTVRVPPDYAYGPHDNEKVRVIDRQELPSDIPPAVGVQIQIKKNDGGISYVTVTEVDDSQVKLDANHPLAGKDLIFDLQLIDIFKSGPSAVACFKLGSALQDKNHLDEAMFWYAKALRIDPALTEAYYNLGVAHQLSGRSDEAIPFYLKVVELRPDHRDAYHNLGNAYKETGEPAKAIECYQKALELDPAFASAYNSMGTVLQESGEIEKALNNYKKAIEYNEDFHEPYLNIGTALQEKGQLDEAVNHYRDALRIKPDFVEAHVGLSSALLLSGNFKEGWQEYEWRYTTDKSISQIHYSPCPVWEGSPLTEKTLMIYAEQGVGDEIMFASCIPEVAGQSDSNCIVECDTRLVPLFSRSFPTAKVIARIQTKEDPTSDLRDIDMKLAMGSLPRILRPNLDSFPKINNYLIADEHKVALWHDRIAEIEKGLNIGISWRGGGKPSVQRKRSISLIQLLQSIGVPGVQFINLQYGDCKDEIEGARVKSGIVVLDSEDVDPLRDLDNFAALIDALDLVISVDNATVHLAGALGKRVWTLLPFAPDWRWMLEREDSPWYPTMRLFRQPSPGEWKSVLDRVEKSIKDLLSNSKST